MNKLFKFLSVLALGLLVWACTPDKTDVGAPDIDASDLVLGEAYTIQQDADNPNIVYLKSLLPSSYTPLWVHPQGNSQKAEVKLEIPFAGNYEIKFGVMTRGGIVYSEPYELELTTICTDFISDPLWTVLAGGIGESKTWVLDIDADKKTTYFKGPKWFFSNGYTWDALHLSDGTSYLDMIDRGDDFNVEYKNTIAPYDVDGAAAWYWAADYAGNSWMCSAENYGKMTFDLKDGANVTITDGNGTVTKGTYMLNTETHEITFANVVALNCSYLTSNPSSIRVLALDDDRMQLGFVPNPPYNSPDDPAMDVYNYVTEAYFENPPVIEDPEPTEPELPDGWEDAVSQITQTSIKWTLSEETPFDWCALSGKRKNGFTSLADYNNGWCPVPDPSAYAKFSLTLDSKDNSALFVAPDGTETAGAYMLDAKGIYTFDFDIDFALATFNGWTVDCATDADRQWRIMSIATDAAGHIQDMWVGAKEMDDATGQLSQYMAYRLVANAGQGSGENPSEPVGKEIPVNNAYVYKGDLEGNGNFRVELYNEYGGHGLESVVQPSDIAFSNYMTVNFTISNLKFKTGAAGSYVGGVFYVAQGWSATVDTRNETDGVKITGDGSYSLKVANAGGASGATVFVIDMLNMFNDLENPDGVKIVVNSIAMDGVGTFPEPEAPMSEIAFDSTKAVFGDIEGAGTFRIDLYNEWGNTGTNSDPGFTPSEVIFNEKLRVTYTLSGTGVSEGSYSPVIIFQDAGWAVNYWSESSNQHVASNGGDPVTGDGTYTVTLTATAAANGAIVFCIDIPGLASAIAAAGGDPATIGCTIDKIEVL